MVRFQRKICQSASTLSKCWSNLTSSSRLKFYCLLSTFCGVSVFLYSIFCNHCICSCYEWFYSIFKFSFFLLPLSSCDLSGSVLATEYDSTNIFPAMSAKYFLLLKSLSSSPSYYTIVIPRYFRGTQDIFESWSIVNRVLLFSYRGRFDLERKICLLKLAGPRWAYINNWRLIFSRTCCSKPIKGAWPWTWWKPICTFNEQKK